MLKSFVSRKKACAKDFCQGFLNKKFRANGGSGVNFFSKMHFNLDSASLGLSLLEKDLSKLDALRAY